MSRCVRPGCAGTYRPDGSCSECGYLATGQVRPVSADDGAGPGENSGLVRSAALATRSAVNPTVSPRLDGGLVDMPDVPPRDHTSAVLRDPKVPLSRQRCHVCGTLVGQPRDGRPRFSEGYCPDDGTPFSFTPALSAGDVLDGRYEVLGAIAYGGLGWIYLARDNNLRADNSAGRWVVLKGLIDADDVDAVESAQNEKRFLVEVDHPNIVKIHDFVRHTDRRTGRPVGYIVMEYLGGRSLQEIFTGHLDRNGERAPLPLPVVLTYGLAILDALGHLHGEGLVYCDLKPDNVVQVGRRVKLIDLGAVVRVDARPRAVYGTPGFQAPELGREGHPAVPSVASDLYTVGRTLAVLSFPFPGFNTTYRHSLPPREEEPLLAREDSYDRLLRRAAHPDPERRFASAAEMREQLQGVLRELVPDRTSALPSTLFTPVRQTFGMDAGLVPRPVAAGGTTDWTVVPWSLPTPLIDLSDPNAAFLATLGSVQPAELVDTLLDIPERSSEVLLRLVDAELARSGHDAAADYLGQAERSGVLDWRRDWYRGVIELATGRISLARQAFDAVRDELPGELAPKLALAVAAERDGDDTLAGTLYRRVWRTDGSQVSAGFGLARVLGRAGHADEAVAVLDDVPANLSGRLAAQIAAIRFRLEPRRLTRTGLVDASARLDRLTMSPERRTRMTIEVLGAALRWVLTRGGPEDDESGGAGRPGPILGRELAEYPLRRGLERAYRDLAKLAGEPALRSALVDRANQVRPRTLV